MLNFLFRRLTADPHRGAELFDAVTAIARQHAWYTDAGVPDTLDGRFAVLATVTALVMTRLEKDGVDGDLLSVALTERFVEVMEAEHREMGLGDPTLGKQVRKLVGSLARRARLWRGATAGTFDWATAALESLYREEPRAEARKYSETRLRDLWETLQGTSLDNIRQGRIE